MQETKFFFFYFFFLSAIKTPSRSTAKFITPTSKCLEFRKTTVWTVWASKMLNKFWKTDFKRIFAFFFLDNQDSISKVHSSLFFFFFLSSWSLVWHMTSYSVDWAANHWSLEVIVFLHKITYDGQVLVSLYLCALHSDKLKAPLGLFFYNSSLRRVKKKDASSENRPTFLHSLKPKFLERLCKARDFSFKFFFNCEWNCKNERD